MHKPKLARWCGEIAKPCLLLLNPRSAALFDILNRKQLRTNALPSPGAAASRFDAAGRRLCKPTRACGHGSRLALRLAGTTESADSHPVHRNS